MAKKKGKGVLLSSILLIVGILVQIATIGIVYVFLKDAKAVQKYEEAEEAKNSVEWAVPFEELAITETTILNRYVANAEHNIRSYWHGQDRDFRLTIKSPALRELISQRVLLVREGKASDHLTLTVYYNPLRLKNPMVSDLIPIYRLVRYQKPELLMLYEAQELAEDEEILDEDVLVENEATSEESENESVNDKDEEEESPKKEEEKPLITEEDIHLPFDQLRVMREEYEFIIYEDVRYDPNEIMLNMEFLAPYLDEDSFQGDYGWQMGLFYWETSLTVEEESESDEEEEASAESEEESQETSK